MVDNFHGFIPSALHQKIVMDPFKGVVFVLSITKFNINKICVFGAAKLDCYGIRLTINFK